MRPFRPHPARISRRRRQNRLLHGARAKRQLALTLLIGGSLLAPTAHGLVRSASHYQATTLHLGWEGVVRQSAFNTCGPAAIATLLERTGSPSTEASIIREARLDASGVTLAEFSRLAEHFGLSGDWVRVLGSDRLDRLPSLSVAHLDDFSGHFVLVLNDIGDYILVGDPARGLLLVPRHDFLEQWSTLLFVLESRADA